MESSGFDRSFAIVIGINDYCGGIPPLQSARPDADAIAQLLETQHLYQVIRLTDTTETKPTLSNIRQLLEQKLPALIYPEDKTRLLFYFAGHGIALNGEEGPTGYLIPQDAQFGNVQTYLPMTEVHDSLLALPCHHFLGILDCCFAGAFRWSSTRKLIPVERGTLYRERFSRFVHDPAWQIITSAAADQAALDAFALQDDRGQGVHSPFATALIDALWGKADIYPAAESHKPAGDGIITATELYLYLRDRVEPPTEARAMRQTPGFCPLKKHDKGEYIFGVPGHDPNLPSAPPLDRSNNPYRGLEPFEEQHQDIFFGRKALAQQLYEFVIAHPFTIVLGTSGSGKSSLVKAGLLPKLRCQKEMIWAILPPFRPGESPFRSLNTALASVNLSAIVPSDEAADSAPVQRLAVWMQEHPATHLLFMVDQFEELITLCHDDQERQQFLNALQLAIAAYPDRFHVLITLRSDFEPQFHNMVLQNDWMNSRFIVPAMTREELREAIEEPAAARVMYFNPYELVDQLIDEVANMPGALPLLSFALSELYLKYLERQEAAKLQGETIDRAITQVDYEAVGGVTQSLTQRADQEYSKLVRGLGNDSAYAQTIRHVMLRMVAVGSGEFARRRVFASELQYPEPEDQRVKRVLQQFLAARLLVAGQDENGNDYIEPAHDVLVRGWQKLLEWRKQEAEDLVLQRRLTPEALRWYRQPDKQLLWNADPRLPLLKEILRSSDSWLNQAESQFVQHSLRQKRKNVMLRRSAIATAFLAITGAAIVAISNSLDARNRTIEALINSANANWTANQQLDAMMDAVEAGQLLEPKFLVPAKLRVEVLNTLRQTVYGIQENNRLEGHLNSVTSVSFSPDAQLIATSSSDSTIRLWSRHGKLIRTIANLDVVIYKVRFSPDGKTLASANFDGTAQLWSLEGKLLHTFRAHTGAVADVRFSPDGKLLASSGRDGTIRIWQINGKLLHTLKGHQDTVMGIRFSPNGQLLASASMDGTLRLWKADGTLLKVLRGHEDGVYAVDISPDQQTIVSAGEDHTVKLWRVDGTLIRSISAHTAPVRQVKFSPDGKLIASGGEDQTVTLWNLDGTQSQSFRGHTDVVLDLAFSPNGKMIASSSRDKTTRLWNLRRLPQTALQDHTGTVWRVRFSPDGKMIASTSADQTVKLWQYPEGVLIGRLAKHPDAVRAIAFSADEQLIATGSSDGKIRIWRRDGTLLKTIGGHQNKISSISFAPDSKTIVSGSMDGTVRLWNLSDDSQKQIGEHEVVNTQEGDDKYKVGVWDVRFSPDGKRIASVGGDGKMKLWNLNGHLLHTVEEEEQITAVDFSPDGSLIAFTTNLTGTIKLWRLRDHSIAALTGHTDWVTDVRFSPDGQFLASAAEDNTIKLWSIDGTMLASIEGDTSFNSVSFNPDGTVLASADENGVINLWNLDRENLISWGCTWLSSYLSNNVNNQKRVRLCK
ncbi:nSTAND1 domain-containing NTPase [Leptolyngbya ohadii]|uniref:nSTAND1 domain-containing NTPase n=1 Tax=Leptolyngbya ohadii TaxID=1962290 RepID=UPI000B59B621|nr:caspase family protein [Leptolyngbya ohadii]